MTFQETFSTLKSLRLITVLLFTFRSIIHQEFLCMLWIRGQGFYFCFFPTWIASFGLHSLIWNQCISPCPPVPGEDASKRWPHLSGFFSWTLILYFLVSSQMSLRRYFVAVVVIFLFCPAFPVYPQREGWSRLCILSPIHSLWWSTIISKIRTIMSFLGGKHCSHSWIPLENIIRCVFWASL